MRRYHVIVLGLVAAFASVHVVMYRAVEANSLAVFERDQRRVVQGAVLSLRASLGSLERQMQTLADLVAERSLTDREAIRLHVYRDVIGTAVTDVVRLRPDGTVLDSLQGAYAVGDDPGWRDLFSRSGAWPHGMARLTNLAPIQENDHTDHAGVLLVAPVRSPTDNAIEEFLVFVLQVERLVDLHILPLALGEAGRGWIVDDNGQILWHPDSPAGSPVTATFSRDSGATWRRMTAKLVADGYAESTHLNIAGAPSVLSCCSMRMTGRRWTICIEAPQSDAVAAVALFPRWLAVSLVGILGVGCAVIFLWGRAQQRTHQAEEARAMLERTLQHQKILALGQLAAGVAHEVGNPLASISALCQLLLRKQPDPELAEPLKTIITHVDRIATTVRRVLSFARPTPARWESLDINAAIHDCLNVLRYDPRMKTVSVQLRLGEPAPRTFALTAAVIQLLTNVIINALDAMEGRAGRLTVSTFEEHGMVCITIADNGIGMTADEAKRAVEPFATTKPEGQGTGLGLAVSRSIVEQHEGTIALDSEPGAGTTVRMELPIRHAVPKS